MVSSAEDGGNRFHSVPDPGKKFKLPCLAEPLGQGSLMSGFATSLGAASKSSKGVTAIVEGATASIEIKAILEYGASAPLIFEQIKVAVRREIKAMTGLDVKDIQFRVVDIMTPEEFERNSKEATKKATPQA